MAGACQDGASSAKLTRAASLGTRARGWLGAALVCSVHVACGGSHEAKSPEPGHAPPPPAEMDGTLGEPPSDEPSLEVDQSEKRKRAVLSTDSDGTPAFASVEEAQASLESAERALGAALAARGSSTDPAAKQDTGGARAGDKKAEGQAGTACTTACAALASMRRAADAICSLAGESDARCATARARLEASTVRATECRCPTT